MESVVQGIALVLTAISATIVVLVRDPKRQIFSYMIFGLILTLLFAALQAPDVALSELAVGAIAIPFAVLATLVRVERGKK